MGPFYGRQSQCLRRAFTLIELLVVIAIIAILAAILFPVFAKARERGMATTCLSNQKQLVQSQMMYSDDHDGRLPIWWTPTGNPTNPALPRDWTDDTFPLFRSAEVLTCPKLPTRKRAFGFNVWLAWGTGAQLTQLKYPSRTCMFAEMGAPDRMKLPASDVDRSSPYGWPGGGDLPRFWFDPNRHFGGANMAFCDGHAAHVRAGSATTWPTNSAAFQTDTPVSAAAGGTPRGTWWWPSDTAP